MLLTLQDITPPRFYIPKKHLEAANRFLSIYDLERYIPCLPGVKFVLKKKGERVCRFCQKTNGETSFKLKAHFFPELLGNHHLLSDFECDACNAAMGKYENDLAHFLAGARTVNSVSAKNNIPKYKSHDSSLVLSADSMENTLTIGRTNDKDGSMIYDSTGESVLIQFRCPPYIPLHVYKSLLKMALSTLPEEYTPDYKHAFQYVESNRLDNVLRGPKVIGLRLLPLTYTVRFPIGMLFKKREENAEAFTHVFCLYFQNFVFQTVIPFYKRDENVYGKKIVLQIAPLLCPTPEMANLADEFEPLSHEIDLSATELKRDDMRALNLPIDKEILRDCIQRAVAGRPGIQVDLNNIVEIQIKRTTER